MIGRPVLRVEMDGYSSLVSGYHAAELVQAVRNRRPVWISRCRGYSVSEETARDVTAAAEARGYDVVTTGPRSRRAHLLDALEAAPAPRFGETDDDVDQVHDVVGSRRRHQPYGSAEDTGGLW